MPRRPRIHFDGVPLHIVQRGHNRQASFFAGKNERGRGRIEVSRLSRPDPGSPDRAASPDSGTTTAEYDAAGNFVARTDARGLHFWPRRRTIPRQVI